MYLKLNKKKIIIEELTTLPEKFKSLKFKLEPITKAYRLVNKKFVTTYFFCQRVDIIVTDKDNNILAIYPNTKSEKKFLPKLKAYYIYYLPVKSSDNCQVNDKLIIK